MKASTICFMLVGVMLMMAVIVQSGRIEYTQHPKPKPTNYECRKKCADDFAKGDGGKISKARATLKNTCLCDIEE
uniref:SLPTX15 n=1 Tax=Hemiscolopendra marginata TaxID=943146 RepID=A0A646QEE0_9MYRI